MRSLYHSHPHLTLEEAHRYAWLAGDPLTVEALEASVDAEPLCAILDNHGIEDLEAFIAESKRFEDSNAELSNEIDDLRAKVSVLEDALRDAIKFMREPLPADEVEAMAADLEEALA